MLTFLAPLANIALKADGILTIASSEASLPLRMFIVLCLVAFLERLSICLFVVCFNHAG
jgi:hypothetical protein